MSDLSRLESVDLFPASHFPPAGVLMRPVFWCIGLFFLMMFGFELPQLRAQPPNNSLVSVDGFKTELISRFMEQH
jgi:hypothetical protein